ncbi:MAG: putative Ig domain-containing protein [Polyangiales bacterium]
MRQLNCVGAVLILVLVSMGPLSTGCGSSNDDGSQATSMTGTVSAPDGSLASADSHDWGRSFAELILPRALALTVAGLNPLPGANVFLIRVDSSGNPTQTLAQTTTNAQGEYVLTLPAGVTFAGDLVVQATSTGTPRQIGTAGTLSAPAVQTAVNVHPATELIMRKVLEFVTLTAAPSFTVFSNTALQELVRVAESAMIADPAPNGSTVDEWITHVSDTIGPDLTKAVTRLGTGVGGLFFFTTELPDGQTNTAYGPPGGNGVPILALSIPPSGLSYAVSSGQLPDGLALNASTGEITGTPTVAGIFTFTILVSSSASGSSRPFTVSVTEGLPMPGAGASLAAGDNFSVARLGNGKLQSWGSDAAGSLGDGATDTSRNVPGPVTHMVSGGATDLSDIVAIAAGSAHTLALDSNGQVWGWGYNGFGQLGISTNATTPIATRMNNVGVSVSGTLILRPGTAVCGGSLHSAVLLDDQTVVCTGYNLDGQLGIGSNNDGLLTPGIPVTGIGTAAAIACGGNHTLALLDDGTVRAWGQNDAGQLGDQTTTGRNAPVTVSGLSDIVAIAAGFDYSMAIKDDGSTVSVWAWGSNVNGKLGVGNDVDQLVPAQVILPGQFASPALAIAAGGGFSMALDSAGVVYTWGINEVGQLGGGSLSPGFRLTPAAVPAFCPQNGRVVEIAAGTSNGLEHALARCEEGSVWAWGYNSEGQLGNGSPNAIFSSPQQVTGLDLN